MAHGEDVKQAVRAAYIFDGLALPVAAAKHGVPEGTARRWKYAASELGDDWDKHRGAQLIAGGGIEAVARQTMALVVNQVQATVQAINDTPNMKPEVKVQMLTSLADAYNKLMAANRKLIPETDQLATSLDVLQQFAQFVKDRNPQHLSALVELLEPFGETLQQRYG